MKKGVNLFIIGIIMFLGCLVKVDAEAPPFENHEIFIHDWDTGTIAMEELENIFGSNKDYQEHGYVTSDLELDYDNETYLSSLIKYDIAGNILLEKEIENTILLNLQIIDDKIYTISLKISSITGEPAINVVIYDFDFKITEQYYLGSGDVAEELLDSCFESKQLKLELFSADENGNGYYLLYGGPIIFAFGPDYDDVEILEGAKYVYEYYPYYEVLVKKSDEYNFIGYDSKDGIEVLSGNNGCSSLELPSVAPKGIKAARSECRGYGVLALYEDGEEAWTNIYDEYYDVINPYFVDEYIVALGIGNSFSEIIIVDFNGKILQKIQLDNYYYLLQGGEKSFMVSSYVPVDSSKCSVSPGSVDGTSGYGIARKGIAATCYEITNEVWYIPLIVETKTDGNGTVTAVESSRYGEEVIFTVDPKEGFVLGEVKVTDENGNVVIFTDYTFTMPNADVLIEATFVPTNPETSDKIIFIGITALILGLVLIHSNKKKISLN